MADADLRAAMAVDHVGVDLWRTSRAWEEAMFAAVVAAGYDDLTLADGDVLVFVGPNGARATKIARSRRITVQGAQDQVRRLVERGYVSVGPDPADRRARLIVLTARGEAMMRDFAAIKRDLHRAVVDALGAQETMRLRGTLERLRAALPRRSG